MRSILSLAVLLTLVGCGPDMPPPPPRTDAGPRDSGPGTLDGDVDAGDAGPTIADGGDSAVPPADAGMVTCAVNPSDRHVLSTDTGNGARVVGLAAGADSFGVIWHETRDGQPDIFGVSLSPSALGTEQRITTNFSRENPPTILANGTGWIAAWVDNDMSLGFELRTQTLGPDLAPTGAVQRITNTAALLEDNPTLANVGGGPFLFWAEDDMVARTRVARALTLNSDGTPSGTALLASEAGQRPGQAAVAELSAGPVALWTEGVGLTQDLLLQPLSADGARSGAPTTISAEGNVDGTVDAALGVTGGAVVFGVLVGGVRREVRFRAMDADGTLLGDERALLTPPTIGTDASIVAFGGGYAVAYRGDDGGGPKIFLMFIDGFGDVLEEIAVSDASMNGGRVTLRASGSGQLGLAWADLRTDEAEIIAALVRCGR